MMSNGLKMQCPLSTGIRPPLFSPGGHRGQLGTRETSQQMQFALELLATNVREVFTIRVNAPTSAFSLLKGPTCGFKNLLRHYVKQAKNHKQ